MNETNKFKDECGDAVQAMTNDEGLVEIYARGEPWLTPDQAIEFAKQLIELAEEVKGNAS